MRRKEKQIQNLKDIEAVIAKAKVFHLAMSVDNMPYVVPLCFGYKDNTFYFHSADEGRKLEMIRKNPSVCFQLHADDTIITAEKACNWSMKYKSVIGFGKAVELTTDTEKQAGLDIIMKQYADQQWEYPSKMLNKTTVIKIEIKELTGKQSLD